MGAAAGALGAGGAAYALSGLSKPKKPIVPAPVTNFMGDYGKYVVPGAAGLAGLGGLMYYLNRRRKRKRMEDYMRKRGSYDDRRLKNLIKAAAYAASMEKSAAGQSLFSKGIGNLFKAFGTGMKGVGQTAVGGIEQLGKGTRKGASKFGRYMSLMTGARGHHLDREARKITDPVARAAADRAAQKEWDKVILTRLLSLAGGGVGVAAIANSEGFE